MTPLAQLPAGAWRGVAGVFTDIDDTLTTSGAITLDALRALSALEAAGLPVIAVTGRPVGWSEPFALGWPVRAIVAENGAVLLTRTGATEEKGLRPAAGGRNQLQKTYQQDAETRRRNFGRLQDAAARVLREVRGATLARDSAGRETDIAIDHS
ncbi:MAG: HAD hydrolase family protein, partial [Ottowia sp.]|nr:HAD hydrolase family protein [Ottowia sp.]